MAFLLAASSASPAGVLSLKESPRVIRVFDLLRSSGAEPALDNRPDGALGVYAGSSPPKMDFERSDKSAVALLQHMRNIRMQ